MSSCEDDMRVYSLVIAHVSHAASLVHILFLTTILTAFFMSFLNAVRLAAWHKGSYRAFLGGFLTV